MCVVRKVLPINLSVVSDRIAYCKNISGMTCKFKMIIPLLLIQSYSNNRQNNLFSANLNVWVTVFCHPIPVSSLFEQSSRSFHSPACLRKFLTR